MRPVCKVWPAASVLLALLAVAPVGGQRDAPPRTLRSVPGSIPQVAFVQKGKLVMQTASGGLTRPAAEAQKGVWRKEQAREPSLVSPDGAYRVVKLGGGNGREDTVSFREAFRIVRVRDGQEIFGEKHLRRLSDSLGPSVSFGQWLPDSRHFVASSDDHYAGFASTRRFGVDVRTGRLAPFNGWASPQGSVAVVPARERMVEERIERHDSGWTFHEVDHYAASHLPSRLSAYEFRSVPRKKLVSGGKPLNVALDGEFLFSRNERWAIYRSKRFGVQYVLSLATGQARKLAGNEAVFLPE